MKRYFLASLVAPLPNSEQINHPFSNYMYTKSTPNHIHHHYAPSVNSHTRHTSSLQLHPHTHHIVPLDLWTDPAGVTALLARWTEKLDGGPPAGRSDSPPPLARVIGVGRQQLQRPNQDKHETHSQHHSQHIPQQPTTQQSHQHHTTHRTSLQNNTPQSNPS